MVDALEVLEGLDRDLRLHLAARGEVERLDGVLAVSDVRSYVTKWSAFDLKSLERQMDEPVIRSALKTVQKTFALMYVSGGSPTATRVPWGRRYSRASL